MKIFKDVITGDEMLTNLYYSMTVGYEDAIIKVLSRLVPKEPIGICYCECMKNITLLQMKLRRLLILL